MSNLLDSFNLLNSRLGDGDQARHFFRGTYEPHLPPPFRVIADTKGGTNPYFATGAGGVLQWVKTTGAGPQHKTYALSR